MDVEKFIDELDRRNWGVASLNTYRQNGNCVYILISQRGDSGRFIKKECFSYEFNDTLDKIINELNEMKKEIKWLVNENVALIT